MSTLLKKILLRISGLKYKILDRLYNVISNKNNHYLVRIICIICGSFLQGDSSFIGSLWVRPSFISWFLSSFGLYNNLNNLGNPFSEKEQNYNFVKKLEKEVIEWNKNILHCSDRDVEGYVTSGGTESNLFLMWAGRELLMKESKIQPVLLLSEFAHYSIKKSGQILGLKIEEVKVSRKTFRIDEDLLIKKITKLVLSGKKSFIIPLTVGYSSTGTSDSILKLNKIFEDLQKKYPKLNLFVWVDAAGQGIVKSFLDNQFRPFENSLIQGYVLDFHKLGQTPLPAGVVLYKSKLRKVIESQIDYLNEFDATISGSRPGFSVLAIWGNIISKDHKYWINHFLKLEKKKNVFISRVRKIFPNAEVISERYSLTIAIRINENFPKLNDVVEEKFCLVNCNINGIKHYKIHILK